MIAIEIFFNIGGGILLVWLFSWLLDEPYRGNRQ